MLSFLASRAGVAMAAIVIALGLLTFSHRFAYQAGKDAERLSRLKADVEAHQKREGIDHEVDGLDRYHVCIGLGGVQSDCEQLRGMEETTGSE
ncbi:MAG: hypothetical protein DCC69_03525 [Hyphomicrobiales bacterium]|nr:MAG: hypothetical protein DCC69_03525 [Hyphomicrobiales bacterium]